MNYNQAIETFKTQFPEPHLINLLKIAKLQPQNTWDVWIDSQGKGLKVRNSYLTIYHIKSDNLPNDLFHYMNINQLLKQSKFVIFTNLDVLSAWILGQDSRLRVKEYQNGWQIKNIFDYPFNLINKIAKIIYDPGSANLPENFYFFNLPLEKSDIEVLYEETQNQGFLCCL